MILSIQFTGIICILSLAMGAELCVCVCVCVNRTESVVVSLFSLVTASNVAGTYRHFRGI